MKKTLRDRRPVSGVIGEKPDATKPDLPVPHASKQMSRVFTAPETQDCVEGRSKDLKDVSGKWRPRMKL